MVVTNAASVSLEEVTPALPAWGERPWHNIQESVVNIQRHWVEVMRMAGVPATSGRDNLHTFALVEAAYRSARSGTPVRPGDLF